MKKIFLSVSIFCVASAAFACGEMQTDSARRLGDCRKELMSAWGEYRQALQAANHFCADQMTREEIQGHDQTWLKRTNQVCKESTKWSKKRVRQDIYYSDCFIRRYLDRVIELEDSCRI